MRHKSVLWTMLTPIAPLADFEFDCFALSWTKLAPSLAEQKNGRVGMICPQTFSRSLIFEDNVVFPSFVSKSSPAHKACARTMGHPLPACGYEEVQAIDYQLQADDFKDE